MNKSAIIALLVCALIAFSSARVTQLPANFKNLPYNEKSIKKADKNTNVFESILPKRSEISERSYSGFQPAYCAYDDTVNPCPFKEIVPVPLVGALPANIQNTFNQIKNKFNQLNNAGTQYNSGTYASVTYNGAKIWEYTWGTVSRDSTAKMNGNTIFRIASISKVFTALSVFRLFQDGKIKSLDDPISTYYPAFKIKTFYNDTRGPTLRQMLSHVSGLPRETPCNAYDGESCYASKASIVAKFFNQYTYGVGNKEAQYSNAAFDLLGRLLEDKMGMTWENYVKTKILIPLGMTKTFLTFDEAFYDQMAIGYGANYGWEEVWLNDLGFTNPSGGMYSTPNDLNKLFQELNKAWTGTPTKFLNHDLVRQGMHPHFVGNDLQTMFGAPYEMFPHSGYLVVAKGGNYDGYSVYQLTVPDLQLTMNIFFNADACDAEFYIMSALDLLLPSVISTLNGVVPIPTIPTATQNKLVGRYVYIEGFSEATVTKQGQALSVHFTYNDYTYYFKATSNPTVFILVPPQDSFTCDWYLFSGNQDIPMYITLGSGGNVVSFELPAAYVDVTFTKV